MIPKPSTVWLLAWFGAAQVMGHGSSEVSLGKALLLEVSDFLSTYLKPVYDQPHDLEPVPDVELSMSKTMANLWISDR